MTQLLGYHIHNNSLEAIDVSAVTIINTINPHSYCMAKRDGAFETALQASDVLLPDGVGIVWAEKVLNGNRIQKIAGFDLFMFLMQRANTLEQRVFFLGASQTTLDAIHARAAKDFPKVQVYSYSPPYKAVFSESDSKTMCAQVNAVAPDVLFVGMTAPKQEKWVHAHKTQLNAQLIGSIGAVFDFYAGTVKRPSTFWINLGLEWLPRLVQEPRRLFKRNFVSTPKFILEVLSHKVFGKGVL
jgi:N-acetylglucosaminyldiphosphoundecaprenol N-acetyl-beta-D-mannosaminyltransferase